MLRNIRPRPVSTADAVFAFLVAMTVAAAVLGGVVPGAGPAGAAAKAGSLPTNPLVSPGLVESLVTRAPMTAPPKTSPGAAVQASASAPATTLPPTPVPAGPSLPAAGTVPAPAVPTTTSAPAPAAAAGQAPAPAVVNLPAGAGTITSEVPAASVLQQPAVPKKWLPSGKGMWIYEPAKTEGGNAAAIVARAKATGLTHLWVRMGSAWDGFNVAPFLNSLLPAAHAAGIKVIGWDFPKLDPVATDVARATAMIHYTTPSGDRVDAFSPDIESPAEGTHLTAAAARAYGETLRDAAGADYPLIVTVPRPAKERPTYPYADIVAGYDAIAPMVYWLDRQPDSDVIGALDTLAKFGKPVYPVGQAYDGSPEGGRKGVPPPDELFRFMTAAASHGAAGISFWSWQAANQPAWNAIHDAAEFRLLDSVKVGSPFRDPEASP